MWDSLGENKAHRRALQWLTVEYSGCLLKRCKTSFVKAKRWKQLKGPLIDKWTKKKMWLYNEYYMLNHFSRVQLFVTLWTVACQAPLSMGFPRQEYWSGLPFPPPGDLPNPGIESASLTSPELAGGFFTISTTWEALYTQNGLYIKWNIIQC